MMVIFSFMSDNNETTSTTRPLSVFFLRCRRHQLSRWFLIVVLYNMKHTHTHTQKKCRSFSSIIYYVPSVFHSWIQSFKIIEKKDPTVRLRKRHSLFFFFFLLFPPCFYVSCDINSVLKWKNHRTRDAWVVFFSYFTPAHLFLSLTKSGSTYRTRTYSESEYGTRFQLELTFV